MHAKEQNAFCISDRFSVQGQETLLAVLSQHPLVAMHIFLTWRLTKASDSFLHKIQFNFSAVDIRCFKVPILMLEMDSPFLGTDITDKH